MEDKEQKFDDLKICDCGNGKILAVMNKETWETITQAIEIAVKYYKQSRASAELEPINQDDFNDWFFQYEHTR